MSVYVQELIFAQGLDIHSWRTRIRYRWIGIFLADTRLPWYRAFSLGSREEICHPSSPEWWSILSWWRGGSLEIHLEKYHWLENLGWQWVVLVAILLNKWDDSVFQWFFTLAPMVLSTGSLFSYQVSSTNSVRFQQIIYYLNVLANEIHLFMQASKLRQQTCWPYLSTLPRVSWHVL